MLQLLLDVLTKMYRTLSLLTYFGMVTAERDQLFADGASAVGFALALTGVRDHTLHFVTAG